MLLFECSYTPWGRDGWPARRKVEFQMIQRCLAWQMSLWRHFRHSVLIPSGSNDREHSYRSPKTKYTSKANSSGLRSPDLQLHGNLPMYSHSNSQNSTHPSDAFTLVFHEFRSSDWLVTQKTIRWDSWFDFEHSDLQEIKVFSVAT